MKMSTLPKTACLIRQAHEDNLLGGGISVHLCPRAIFTVWLSYSFVYFISYHVISAVGLYIPIKL